MSPEEKGLAIALETDRRDAGFGNYIADITMILTNGRGDASTREFELRTLEVRADGDKTLSVFSEPRALAGTAILTYSHSLEADDQWLYLPGLKRVKRISAKHKSGPFIGSEFAYEDLGSWEVEKYTYRYLREEVLDGRECYVIENTPAYAYSGYSRQIEWVDKEIHQPRKIVFFDRKDALLKTLTFKEYDRYLGRYWRASEMVMENHQSGKTTRLMWDNYRFRANIDEGDFTRTALRRAH